MCFAFSPPMLREETHPREQSAWGECSVCSPLIGCHKTGIILKPDTTFFPCSTQHNSKKRPWSEYVCFSLCEITSVALGMPAYATNMRLKFPIIALTLEIITIILFALFVDYDDGKSHGHSAHPNETHHEAAPMDLYPSKSGLGCSLTGCGQSLFLSLDYFWRG